ncbi:hypothetical protein D3C71_1232270 [compost metagenome]
MSITTSKPATVYLVEQSIPVDQISTEGVKIDVLNANTPTPIQTNGLPSGVYNLVTVEGNIIKGILIP